MFKVFISYRFLESTTLRRSMQLSNRFLIVLSAVKIGFGTEIVKKIGPYPYAFTILIASFFAIPSKNNYSIRAVALLYFK